MTGACHTGNHVEDVAYMTLDFGHHLLAHFHVNWLSLVTVHYMIFGGSDCMVIYNDNMITERVRALRDHAQSEKYRHEEVGWMAYRGCTGCATTPSRNLECRQTSGSNVLSRAGE